MTPYEESMAEWRERQEWDLLQERRDEIEARAQHEIAVDDDRRDDGTDYPW